jgi:hypothetical protein
MYMNEELLTDERFLRLDANRQSELITEYCADIEDRIRSAPSRLEALRLSESSCTRFEQACPSALLRKALETHIEELILQYWDRKNI